MDGDPRACPACGRMDLRLERTDHWLSLFFVPLAPVKKGRPLLVCGTCGGVFDETGRKVSPPGRGPAESCRFCGRVLDGDFSYCPSCGTPRPGAPGRGRA